MVIWYIPDGHVLITFFNNTISNVSQLPVVPGRRVAISFKSNEIVDIEDDAFSKIEGLVYLDLSNNYISGMYDVDIIRVETGSQLQVGTHTIFEPNVR